MKKILWTTLGVAILALLFLAVFIPWQMSFTNRVPLDGTPADQGIAYEKIVLKPSDQDIDLKAWWMPADKPIATVLFIHGGNGNKTDPWFGTLEFYEALHDRHLNILALDLRNHGESGASESGRLTFGREEQLDAAAGAQWIREKHPNLPMFGAGISMGGATLVQMTGSGVDTDGLILVDPILDNKDAILLSLHAILGWPEAMGEPSTMIAQWYFNEREGVRDPGEIAADMATPILLISDEYDPVTTVRHARALARRNPAVDLLVIPKSDDDNPTGDQGGWTGHVTAFIRQPEQVMSAIDAFIAEQTGDAEERE